MKLSLFIGAMHRPEEPIAQRLSEHAEQVRLARQLGFDGVSIGNHLSYGTTAWFPPFETLMRLAAESDGMSLGTCMLILPLYQPFHVAEQVALLYAARLSCFLKFDVNESSFSGSKVELQAASFDLLVYTVESLTKRGGESGRWVEDIGKLGAE